MNPFGYPMMPQMMAAMNMLQNQQNTSSNQQNSNQTNGNFNDSSQPPRNRKRDISQVRCYRCDEKGHYANQCTYWNRSRDLGRPSTSFGPKQIANSDLRNDFLKSKDGLQVLLAYKSLKENDRIDQLRKDVEKKFGQTEKLISQLKNQFDQFATPEPKRKKHKSLKNPFQNRKRILDRRNIVPRPQLPSLNFQHPERRNLIRGNVPPVNRENSAQRMLGQADNLPPIPQQFENQERDNVGNPARRQQDPVDIAEQDLENHPADGNQRNDFVNENAFAREELDPELDGEMDPYDEPDDSALEPYETTEVRKIIEGIVRLKKQDILTLKDAEKALQKKLDGSYQKEGVVEIFEDIAEALIPLNIDLEYSAGKTKKKLIQILVEVYVNNGPI